MAWQVGDEAVCVSTGEINPNVIDADIPEKGKVYIVSEVCLGRWPNGVEVECLKFKNLRPGIVLSTGGEAAGSVSSAFRKVVRDKTEKCEEEFLTLLKGFKKKAKA